MRHCGFFQCPARVGTTSGDGRLGAGVVEGGAGQERMEKQERWEDSPQRDGEGHGAQG